MTDASVGFLLEQLQKFLTSHAALLKDVKQQIEHLFKDLCIFKCYISDYTNKSNMTSAEKEFAKQVRELVYRCEEIINIYAHVAFTPGALPFEKTIQFRKLKSEIKSIMGEVEHMYEMMNTFPNLLAGEENCHGRKRNEKALILEDAKDHVVGFEDEKGEVITLLKQGSDELEAVPIVGMPGLGKTTLAKMVFYDSYVIRAFKVRVWVDVSESSTTKEVLVAIFDNVGKVTAETEKMTVANLVEEIRLKLSEKYLVVLDNVGTMEIWNNLIPIFPCERNGSRIILTTSMSDVAKNANQKRDPHHLRFLDSEESWEFLQMKALGEVTSDKKLERYGRFIANQCKGLPLAIAEIGEFLSAKGHQSYWCQKVVNSVGTYLFLPPNNRMVETIEESYNQLPYTVKSCFISFGMFPKGNEFSAKELFHLWIAEGFIGHQNGMSLEDVAEKYLEDLIDRNLVSVVRRRLNGKIKTCKVHDVIREFCKKYAEDEKFCLEIKCDDEGTRQTVATLTDVRRLCISSGIFDLLSEKSFGLRVRSLLCFSSKDIVLEPKHIEPILRGFGLTRVMRIRPLKFNYFPGGISRLIHLKFLVLCGNFKVIPPSISRLWNLETIVIETNEEILEFGADISTMTQLRHVITTSSISLPTRVTKPRRYFCLSSLQTFSGINPLSLTADLISSFPNIKKLGICGKLDAFQEAEFFKHLDKLRYLNNLKIQVNVEEPPPTTPLVQPTTETTTQGLTIETTQRQGQTAEIITGEQINETTTGERQTVETTVENPSVFKLPNLDKLPQMLNKLTLIHTELNSENMLKLGKLENLETLKLIKSEFTQGLWQSEDGAFRVLEDLHIVMTDLVTWEVSAGDFPQLRCLYLKHCKTLKAVPLGFADIASLELMELDSTTKDAENSVKEIVLRKQNTTSANGFNLIIASE